MNPQYLELIRAAFGTASTAIAAYGFYSWGKLHERTKIDRAAKASLDEQSVRRMEATQEVLQDVKTLPIAMVSGAVLPPPTESPFADAAALQASHMADATAIADVGTVDTARARTAAGLRSWETRRANEAIKAKQEAKENRLKAIKARKAGEAAAAIIDGAVKAKATPLPKRKVVR